MTVPPLRRTDGRWAEAGIAGPQARFYQRHPQPGDLDAQLMNGTWVLIPL